MKYLKIELLYALIGAAALQSAAEGDTTPRGKEVQNHEITQGSPTGQNKNGNSADRGPTEKDSAKDATNSAGDNAKGDGDDSSGYYKWIALAVVILCVKAVIIYFVMRRKYNKVN
ncbi:hypothetical protein ENBRE01_2849 [Enteropsectra breve]|nr:hypothetical protein ENBRE01_2849 [Enteropsectra breve]